MLKKVLSILLVITFVVTSFASVTYADTIQFPDLPSDHWAYNSVMTLVADGTVKGNDLGLYDPNKQVSRAEFVKMIGKSNIIRNKDYADVPPTHWSYDYVMASGFEVSGNNFEPDKPITRGETLDLLWTRAGKPSGIVAPSIIADQWKNKESVSWIYMYGVMIGDDGVNLRLNSTLTRAEAAVLIIRTRSIDLNGEQITFADKISPDLSETIFNSIKLFDFPYSADRTITNGELARAALRLSDEEYNLSYRNYITKTPFEHPYALDFAIAGKTYLSDEKITPEFIDKAVTQEDALAVLTYHIMLKSSMSIAYGKINNYYSDLPVLDKNIKNVALTYANQNGVQLAPNRRLNPDKIVTVKDISAMLLQLDHVIGSQTVISSQKNPDGSYISDDLSILSNTYAYPANSSDFQCILSDLPAYVYTTPFALAEGSTCKESYDFAREYYMVFVEQLEKRANEIKDATGVEVEFAYYPSLVCKTKIGFTFRVLCTITNNNGQTLPFNQVFAGSLATATTPMSNGLSFFLDGVSAYDFATSPAIQFANPIA